MMKKCKVIQRYLQMAIGIKSRDRCPWSSINWDDYCVLKKLWTVLEIEWEHF